MKARDYIEHCFLPWILFLDSKSTLSDISGQKERYFFDLYNHVTEEFKSNEFYELYMFRVDNMKKLLPFGMGNIIFVKTPTAKTETDALYLIFIYSNDKLYYYTIDNSLANSYKATKFLSSKDKEVIGYVKDDSNEIISMIINDLIKTS